MLSKDVNLANRLEQTQRSKFGPAAHSANEGAAYP
jgi:hypothetical protein